MTANEAVGLILSVGAAEDPGAQDAGAYFMEMGEPISIMALGRELIGRSGRDVQIEITGLRPGERLAEQLYDEHEVVSPSAVPGVFRITPTAADAYVTSADVAYLETVARSFDNGIVRQRVFAYLDQRLRREDRAVG
jgi:O-antigen biosynthesis protein WbqV